MTKACPSTLRVINVHRGEPEENELSSSPARPCHVLMVPALSDVITTSCSGAVITRLSGVGVELDHRLTPCHVNTLHKHQKTSESSSNPKPCLKWNIKLLHEFVLYIYEI